jgi:hypothetical protein
LEIRLDDLPREEQEKLGKITAPCLALKTRLENHGFKVVKFRAVVSTDRLDRITVHTIHGIETEIIVDGTLPPGTIKVSALVQ